MNPTSHKIISAVFAIAFVVIVQWFASPLPVFRFLVPAFLIYLGALFFYNYKYLKSQNNLSWWLLVRVPVFVLIWFGLLFIIPIVPARVSMLLLSIPVIFFFETLVANKGQQLGWSLFLFSLVSLLLSLYGFNFYFPLNGLVYLGLIFGGVLTLVRISLESVPHPNNVKWLAGLVLALFSAEMFWVLQFLPLYFSVLAIINFIILFLLWVIYYHYLYQTLSKKQIQFYLLLAFGLSIIILLSSPWTILN